MDLCFVLPEPAPAGGGSAFAAGLIPALRALGHAVAVMGPDAVAGSGGVPVIDGMVLPLLEPWIDALVARDAVVVVHHVTAGAGRDMEARDGVRAVERRMLSRLRRVVATSAEVAGRLSSDFGVAEPIVFQPGIADFPLSAGSGGQGCHILSPGVLTPRKGHDRLLRALGRLTDLDWTLTIAGDAQRDPVHAATVAALIEELGLGQRVTLLRDPTVEALEPEWGRADLMALGTAWEAYPATVAEALRRGVPVVAPRVGGIGAMVPNGAGVICPPDDAATFSKSLRRAIFDTALRASLAAGAREAGAALPGWAQQALVFQTILEG